MINQLSPLALGVVVFAITVAAGLVILNEFGSSMLSCPPDSSANGSWVRNTSADQCYENWNKTNTTTILDPSGSNSTMGYLNGKLGTSGLAGWTGAVIALVIGLIFIYSLSGKRKY
jgi:hypothetical protein